MPYSYGRQLFSIVLLCFSLQVLAEQDESHLPPGFRSNLSLDPSLAIVYENLRGSRRDFSMDQIFKILSGQSVGEFHLQYTTDSQGRAMMGSLLPAWKCDGGYAFLSALYVKEEGGFYASRNPAVTIDLEKLEKESPSMPQLIGGMHHFLREEYAKAEPKLLKSIFINIFGKEAGLRKAKAYRQNEAVRDTLIDEANKQIASMKFSQAEYEQCDPFAESTRLMLAQWGAWALTSLKILSYEKTRVDAVYDEMKKINLLEKATREKSHKLRATEKSEFYVSRSDTKGFDF